jgi:hypothetical protein
MSGTETTYITGVRSFDHGQLARYPAYSKVREALSDLANQAGHDEDCTMTLAGFLEAVRDMALTAPYGDTCEACQRACLRQHPRQPGEDKPCDCAYGAYYPHQVQREDEWLTCYYSCRAGHEWTCGYSVRAAYLAL